MAIRNILKEEDDILHKKSREVTVFDSRLHQLLDDMAQTMHTAEGVGLAAVQVGVLRRAVIVDIEDEHGLLEFVNPVVIKQSRKHRSDREGCLSFKGEWGMVDRPVRITVEAMDRYGRKFIMDCKDLLARAILHEVDHLEGIVFKDVATKVVRGEEE